MRVLVRPLERWRYKRPDEHVGEHDRPYQESRAGRATAVAGMATQSKHAQLPAGSDRAHARPLSSARNPAHHSRGRSSSRTRYVHAPTNPARKTDALLAAV